MLDKLIIILYDFLLFINIIDFLFVRMKIGFNNLLRIFDVF